MQVVSIIAQKGGSGKTTLAIHLSVLAAARRLSTVVIDLDPQRSAEKWANVRKNIAKKDAPGIVAGLSSSLDKMLDVARENGVELVIIDTPPQIVESTIIAAKAADMILVPCLPSIIDLPAIQDTLELLHDADQLEKAVIVINGVDKRTREGNEAEAALKSLNLPLNFWNTHIGERQGFRKCLREGLGITEFDKGSKAAEEISKLYKFVRKHASM